MSTDNGDDFPARAASSGRTVIDKDTGHTLMPIRQNVIVQTSGGEKCASIGKAAAVLTILWIYYFAFGWLWLELFGALGDDLLWAYFGVFTVVAISMGLGVAKSMSAQRVGWWRRPSGKKQDTRGQFCGCQVY